MAKGRPYAALAALCLALALAGCSGGAVTVRSGFPPAASTPAVTGGVQVSGGGGLALAVVLGLAIADAVHWATESRAQGRQWVDAESAWPWWRPIDRGWVDRGP